ALAAQVKAQRWTRPPERSVRNRSRTDDNRRRPLGVGNQGLVRNDQGREGPLFEQSTVGRWLGLGSLQLRRSRQASCNRLQERLPGLPHSCERNRLGLCARLSSSRREVTNNVRRGPIAFSNIQRRVTNAKSIGDRHFGDGRTCREFAAALLEPCRGRSAADSCV